MPMETLVKPDAAGTLLKLGEGVATLDVGLTEVAD